MFDRKKKIREVLNESFGNLKESKLKDRNALRILEINDYPLEIIAEAIELAKEMDNKKGL
jgi:hypothetical protein